MQRFSSDKDGEQTEDAEKKELLRQIRELNSIIEQCEWSLETVRFKDVEERLSEPASLSIPSTLKNLPNIDADLRNDLYRFAGLNCVNVQRNEVTFNFAPASNEQQAKNKYAAQLFIKDEKAHLGKWVMPMSIDMNEILIGTSINSLKDLTPFARTCKHYIDCYTIRQQQFLSLKKYTSNIQHCDLQSNTGYTKISLDLYGVHDRENDKYINITLHLQYRSDRTRPHKIEVETNDKNMLSDDVKQKLKVCLKELKRSDLSTAFDRVLANDSEFTWMRTDDSDSPLELHYSSDSDEEGFLEQLQSERKKSLRRAKKKRELKKKWNERKQQKYTASKITASEDDDSEAHELHTERKTLRNRRKNEEANESHIENSKKSLRKKRKEASKGDSEANILFTENPRASLRNGKEKVASILKRRQNIGKTLSEDDTPKVKNKLKQIKLNFQANLVASSGCTENSMFSPDLNNKSGNNKVKLITSTPLRHGRTSKMPYLETINITDIEKPRKETTNSTSGVLRNLSTRTNDKTPRKSLRLLRLSSKSVHM